MSATLVRFPDGREHFAQSPSGNDPIFAVIAEHRGALIAVVAAFAREDREEDKDEITNAAQERMMAAELALWSTSPTTLGGVAALLAYIGEVGPGRTDETILEYAQDWCDDLGAAVRSFPQRLAAAIRNIS